MAVSGNSKEESGSLFEGIRRRLAQKEGVGNDNSIIPEGLAETIESLMTDWNGTNGDKVNSVKENTRWEKDQK